MVSRQCCGRLKAESYFERFANLATKRKRERENSFCSTSMTLTFLCEQPLIVGTVLSKPAYHKATAAWVHLLHACRKQPSAFQETWGNWDKWATLNCTPPKHQRGLQGIAEIFSTPTRGCADAHGWICTMLQNCRRGWQGAGNVLLSRLKLEEVEGATCLLFWVSMVCGSSECSAGVGHVHIVTV